MIKDEMEVELNNLKGKILIIEILNILLFNILKYSF